MALQKVFVLLKLKGNNKPFKFVLKLNFSEVTKIMLR